MLPQKTPRFILATLLASALLFGMDSQENFSSGQLKSLSVSAPHRRQAKEMALKEFFSTHAPPQGFEWELISNIGENTHIHSTYQLKFKGRRVLDTHLKIHFNRAGWVEYAHSNFRLPFSISFPQTARNFNRQWLENELLKRRANLEGKMSGERVIWVDPKSSQGIPAILVRFHEWQRLPRVLIVHEETGQILEEKRVDRNASANVKVYKISPYGSRSPETVTLSDLTDTTSLRNSYLRVRREQPNTTVTPTGTSTIDVVPQDFTGTFSTSPSSYNYSCENSSGSQCPNQGFDAVNVFYHLSQFRNRVVSHLSTLGLNPTFTYDPLDVLINPLSLSTSSNNAAYVGEPCRTDGTMPRCLIFLRPDVLSGSSATSNCSKSSSQFYDLAREGLVVAHEYQHYVTDMITGIIFSSTNNPTFGDALHEGYSDYLAASHVSNLNNTDVTLVGEYALQDCTPLQRQLNTLRVYTNGAVEEDPHVSGLSWASGLWKMRSEFGGEATDLIAIKSLFFLSTNPGALEAVEALVRADKALNAGVHVSRIREIFYKDIKFIGGSESQFEDSTGKIVDVGLKGCGAVTGTPDLPLNWWVNLLLLGVFCVPIFLGRRFFVLLCFLFIPSVWAEEVKWTAPKPPEPVKFSRTCNLLSKPTAESSVACTRKGGTVVSKISPGSNGFVQVETNNCTGYAFVTCLNGVDPQTYSSSVRRSTASGSSMDKRSKLLIAGHFDGPLGKAAGTSTLSKGMGFGLQTSYMMPLNSSFVWGGGPLFQYMRLGRGVDATGALVDPNPVSFDRTVLALGAQTQLHYLISGRAGYGTGAAWWVGGGIECWIPIKSKQTDSTGDEISVTPGKFLVAKAGPSIDFGLSPQSSLLGSLEVFYNVGRPSPPTFYGLRLEVALQFAL